MHQNIAISCVLQQNQFYSIAPWLAPADFSTPTRNAQSYYHVEHLKNLPKMLDSIWFRSCDGWFSLLVGSRLQVFCNRGWSVRLPTWLSRDLKLVSCHVISLSSFCFADSVTDVLLNKSAQVFSYCQSDNMYVNNVCEIIL